jgi:hypothetical protein
MSLCSYSGQNFVPKLKDHILPRIKEILKQEATSNPDICALQGLFPAGNDRDAVFFQNNRMYRHHLARFNYTTYDIRRAQDVVNPGTSHRDIMLLANTTESSDHPFLYCRVLGIYHVNVIYTGEGMIDYNARRIDFLWVRWFEYDGNRSVRWEDFKLDSLRFPPLATEDAFGFVDPRHVLRGSHIVPAFTSGKPHRERDSRSIPAFASEKTHRDAVSLSKHACDVHDWSRYYVDRYVTQFCDIDWYHPNS